MDRRAKISVTVITGFLGAGKSTFINHLLKWYSGVQFALVENEFGDVPIDTKLIKGVDASQMFELKQGCICCTISDEYEQVLKELAERFPNVEHLLIETTGIADPAPVVQPFFADKNLQEIYNYNGTICLVDALNFKNHPEQETTIKQLTIADLVLVNKTEAINSVDCKALSEDLERLVPLANIQLVSYGKVENLQLEKIQQQAFNEYRLLSYASSHASIQTKTISFSKAINKAAFLHWLEYTLDIYKTSIYRCKGYLCFENEPYEYILQGVGGRFELEEGELLLDAAESKVVFMGKLDGLSLDFTA
ncbi:GTP-binding protein [uncultured Draconibacterium sp.]|uniref:CobW family GTP-binding protein n=1 Tax=uncultured Draconibacterium sp. TaxID=1573823 RepID=UPI0032602433